MERSAFSLAPVKATNMIFCKRKIFFQEEVKSKKINNPLTGNISNSSEHPDSEMISSPQLKMMLSKFYKRIVKETDLNLE